MRLPLFAKSDAIRKPSTLFTLIHWLSTQPNCQRSYRIASLRLNCRLLFIYLHTETWYFRTLKVFPHEKCIWLLTTRALRALSRLIYLDTNINTLLKFLKRFTCSLFSFMMWWSWPKRSACLCACDDNLSSLCCSFIDITGWREPHDGIYRALRLGVLRVVTPTNQVVCVGSYFESSYIDLKIACVGEMSFGTGREYGHILI